MAQVIIPSRMNLQDPTQNGTEIFQFPSRPSAEGALPTPKGFDLWGWSGVVRAAGKTM